MVTQTQTKSKKLRERKQAAVKMSKRLIELGYHSRGERMSNCMSRVQYAICESCGKFHITQTYLCRDRLCSICAAGLARKRWWSMMAAAEAANNWDGNKIAMLTLTVKNCAPSALKSTLKAMAVAFKLLAQRKFWKTNIIGYARQLEITYNANTNELHPHYHIMLVLAPDADNLGVIGKTIATDWKHALRVNYAPIWDIRYAYTKKDINKEMNNSTLISYYAEMSKYLCKPLQLIAIQNDTDMANVISAMSGVRMASYGGCVKDARLKANVDADDSLESTKIDLTCCDADMIVSSAHWALGEWVNDITEEVAF